MKKIMLLLQSWSKMSIKKEILGWTLYDFANTAFSALFVTFFFPVFIKTFLGGTEFHLGLVMGISMLASGIFVPLFGAISDASGKRKPFIITFTICCVFSTIVVAYSNLYFALIFAFLANFFYHSALDIYDSLLTNISSKKNVGLISGYGVGLGYIGTIVSLVMAFAILSIFGWESKQGVQAVFIGTGIFYMFFSIFTFITIKDKVVKKVKSAKESIKEGYKELLFTYRHIFEFKGLLPFLVSSFLFTDAMNTMIIFLYLYGSEVIGISVINFFYIYALMALIAGIGSVIFGKITDKIGHKKTLIIILLSWIAIILLLYFISNLITYVIVGCVGGALLGGVWTVTRPMLLTLVPKEKAAEFFGFQGLTEKFGGALGPILFGYVVVRAGYKPALLIIIALLIIALSLFRFIPTKKVNL